MVNGGTVPPFSTQLGGTFVYSELHLSNVHKCSLAMSLDPGVLRWLLAYRTIEKKTKV